MFVGHAVETFFVDGFNLSRSERPAEDRHFVDLAVKKLRGAAAASDGKRCGVVVYSAAVGNRGSVGFPVQVKFHCGSVVHRSHVMPCSGTGRQIRAPIYPLLIRAIGGNAKVQFAIAVVANLPAIIAAGAVFGDNILGFPG
jgi:hypothetical protein